MLTTILITAAIVCIICLAGALVVHITDDYGPACGSGAAAAFILLCVMIGLFLVKVVLI